MNPFITPDKTLENNRKYNTKPDEQSGDGFFIDKKYQGKLGLSVSHKKLNYLFWVLILVILILVSRIFYLQIIKGGEYYLIAEGNRIKTEIIPSLRGIIYDRNNMPLVENVPKFSLFLEKNIANIDPEKLTLKIEELTFLPLDEIKTIIDNKQENFQEVLISRDISYQQAMVMQGNPEKYNGLKLQLTPERTYYQPENLGHILGYLGKIDQSEWGKLKYQDYQFFNFIGKTGLEKQYEKILHGQPGKIEREVNASGRIIKTLNQQESIPGKDLILTIDHELNQKLAEVLSEKTKNINRSKAAGVAINPQNGEILALVSLPSFDNNLFSNPQKFSNEISEVLNDKKQPLFNRVISGEYPSGSTIKPVIGAAGLQEKLITGWTQIFSSGGITIDVWHFPDWQAGGHGTTNITKALAESVNTFFYYLGGGYKDFEGLGLEKIVDYAKKFGFGNILNIDLPNEAAGFLPTKKWKQETKGEPWYIGDTYHLAIGQGDILVTPLQIANMTAVIANDGKIMQPHLIKEIVDVQTKKTTATKINILNQNFISNENIDIIKKGLRRAVTDGSAISLNSLSFTSAGKTGTAQVGGDQNPHSWFTVFAPYENSEIVLTILIENGGGGDKVALPVAKEVLQWYFSK